ncbi:MAG TPA: type I polyketide synthase, partial [Pyrinomonadaceae bacterium]|nr:type I polyketide synthase [Pyrinomonadaceae bacterium]
WPVRDQPRRAGVSSFGIGGTNAHVVLEEAPSRAPAIDGEERSSANATVYALPLSARNAQALRELAHAYCTRISESLDHVSSDDLRDLCYSAAVRRAHHRPHRLCLIAASGRQLVQQLDAFLSHEAVAGLFANPSRERTSTGGSMPRAGFVFSGQGAQWWGMGRELLTVSTTFRDAIAEIDALFRRHTNNWRLLAELTAAEEKSRLAGAEIEITQCALFALQVALAKMWCAFGIEPVAVIGHSMGEVAAAVVSGALSLEDGVRVIYERGHLLQRAAGQGAMAALELSEEEVLTVLAGGHEGVGIAAINGARTTVVSGESEAVARLVQDLTKRGLMVRELRTSGVAGHSDQVAGISEDLERVLSGMTGRTSDISFISSVEGRRLAGEQLNAAYWKRNLSEPVRFADGMEAILDEAEVFVEMNAHPILGLWVKEKQGAEGLVVAALRRERSEWEVTVEGLAEMYVAGADINWGEVWKGTRANYVRLPAYPWQRERYWIEPRRRVVQRGSVAGAGPDHPFFITRVQSSVQPDTHFWEVDLQSESLAFLKDHRIQDTVVIPASFYIEIALAAS